MPNDLRELYQKVILDHGRTPRNFRRPAHPTCRAEGNNPMCGDALSVFLVLDDRGVIEDAAFEGQGCAISLASASLMTETLKGMTRAEAKRLFEAFHSLCTHTDAEPALPEGSADPLTRLSVFAGVRAFPIRAKCATLPWQTMKAALAGEAEARSK